jgi:hypothetical protein
MTGSGSRRNEEDDVENLSLSALDWIVILAGAAAVAWVNWYFFLAPRRSR